MLEQIKKEASKLLKTETSNDSYSCIINCFFDIKHNAHPLHLETNSYAQHMALNSLYEDIIGIADRFVESYQGKYGIFKNYENIMVYKGNPIDYVKMKVEYMENERNGIKEGYLQQILDEGIELMYSTLYKLKELK